MAKANKLVLKFWDNVKKNDDARIAAQPEPGYDEAVRDIRYIEDDHRLHTLSVFSPKGSSGKLPVIFDVHGGGWYAGDKELNEYYCRALTRYGFKVVDVSYRLSPEVDIFGQISDVFDALNYVFAHSEELGLDMDNFFLTGDSAGGHIVGLMVNVVLSEELKRAFGVDTKVKIKGACLTCPASDPLNLVPFPKSLMKFYFNPVFGKGYLKNDKIKYMSYFNVLSKGVCPMFFITCNGDFLKSQTLKAYEATKKQGTKVGLFFLEKPYEKEHKLAHVFNILHWEWDEAEAANRAMCDFFKSI